MIDRLRPGRMSAQRSRWHLRKRREAPSTWPIGEASRVRHGRDMDADSMDATSTRHGTRNKGAGHRGGTGDADAGRLLMGLHG